MCSQQTNATNNQSACGSEAHNSISLKANQHQQLLTAAFVMEGLRDVKPNYDALITRWDRGCIELVDALVSYVPLMTTLGEAVALTQDGCWPGVFDYEVSTCFGHWFADYVMEHGDEPPQKEAHAYLIKEIGTFFSQGQSAAEGEAIGKALQDAYASVFIVV